MLRVRDALQRAGIEVFEQQGSTTGTIFALSTPNTYDENPDFAFDDGEVRLTLTGEARGTTAEDELYLASG
jgi:S-adenosylhomocysteine hydrolase